MTQKIKVLLRGGPADGTHFKTEEPAPAILTVPALLSDGLGEARYYRTDQTEDGMPVYEHPGTVH